ncbi:MAG: ferrochelatase [Alphaproteobacteria bacterium]|nr:MAG: ferrochelatase [Alphaproteobacteria bacterium]
MPDSVGRTAVVLFNLGGPDGPDSVRPFLFNLFNDPAIIGAPAPVRWMLARWISHRRAPIARKIYAHLGGGSPLVVNTQAQARALEQALAPHFTARGGALRIFICMRYWHPMSDAVARAVKTYRPDRIVLLPLYPQFSTTTTGSSLKDWRRAAAGAGLDAATTTLCCYPIEDGFVREIAERMAPALERAMRTGRPRVLFSAHGLPEKIVAAGDPYQWQVERTAAAVVARLEHRDLDWTICYQSRVGPLEWIGPATDTEITRAGRDRVPVVVVPIAFVSEHSETLVELDIEYARLARETGVPAYERVPTVDAGAAFIAGLARLVTQAVASDRAVCSHRGTRFCPAHWTRCVNPA